MFRLDNAMEGDETVKKIPYLIVLLAAIFSFSFAGCSADYGGESSDTLYQVSTLNALMQGIYDGEISFGELERQGDFGIGTFDGLEGEMILLDGQAYQVLVSGQVEQVSADMTTPFAAVTFFEADQEIELAGIINYAQLQQELDKLLPSRNIFYAIRVEGDFSYVLTRSVAKQSKPYPPLVAVTEDQQTFEFADMRGTLAGFWCPSYAEGVNLPGYHLHFLSDDFSCGGHLLECSLSQATVYIDYTNQFEMFLPQNEAFLNVDLEGASREDVQKAEQNPK